MEAEAGEFQDWEVLHSSVEHALANSSDSEDNSRDLGGIDGDSGGMIRSDYFSLDSIGKYARTVSEDSVDSDNPSWIDPDSEGPYPSKGGDRGELWSDSSSDRSDDRKFNDFDAKNELGFVENSRTEVGSEGIGEIGAISKESEELLSGLSRDGSDDHRFNDFHVKNELSFLENAKNQVGVEGTGEIRFKSENTEKSWSDSSGTRPNQIKLGDIGKDNKIGVGDCGNSQEGSSEEVSAGENTEEVAKEAVKSAGGEEKRTVVWWKVPMEFLKFCVFRVSPVWTFSVAAAVMAFVILGRRLYKMKRKSRNMQLKVTLDDTKVSQFMKRAARLNEAFSVVKRVPIVRPSLSAVGVTPWPVMSLR